VQHAPFALYSPLENTPHKAIVTAQNANRWLAPSGSRSGQAELLDCEYFHVVFTFPEQIAAHRLSE
jgi:hypothetical protein